MKSSILDGINAKLRGYPVGAAEVEPFERAYGHEGETYSPESYGNYLVTSNEIFSAAMLRARLVSSVPIKAYKGSGDKKTEVPTSGAAELLKRVNAHWTWARLARMDELSMCIWGQSAWAIERNSDGIPRNIWWLKPTRLRPVPHPTKYLSGYLYHSNVGGEPIPFRTDEILWQRYPNILDEFAALSPVAAARLAADAGSAMMKANKSLHDQGLQIAGMVMPKQKDGHSVQFTPEQATELEDKMQRRFAGADKAHRWAVLRYEAEFKPVNITPKDAEFVLGLGLTMRQICNAYGIPAPLLNDLEHATLANVREFQTGLWEHALVPDLGLKAAEIEEQLLPMFTPRPGVPRADHVEFDFDGVPALQKAKSETWDRDRSAIEVGALTVNEWRKKNGLPPVKWGDVWFGPVNKSPIKDEKGAKVAAPPAPPAEDAPAITEEDERMFQLALNGHREWV